MIKIHHIDNVNKQIECYLGDLIKDYVIKDLKLLLILVILEK